MGMKKLPAVARQKRKTRWRRSCAAGWLAGLACAVFIAGAMPRSLQGQTADGPFCARPASFAMGASVLDGYLTARGRLFASRDGWQTWRKIGEGSDSAYFASVAVDPHDPLRLYHARWTEGVWRSDDGGASWREVNQGLPDLLVADVLAPAGRPDLVYVVASYTGVFRSRNGGLRWQDVSPPATRGTDNYSRLVAHPKNPSRLWLSTEISGIWISDDGGDSWRQANEGLPSLADIQLAVDPTDPDTAFATIYTTLYKTDDGATWTEVGRIPLSLNFYVWSLLALGGDVLLAGQGTFEHQDHPGLLRSRDGGMTWEETSLLGEDATGLVHLPEAGGFVVLTASGIYFSPDLGETFTRIGTGVNAGRIGSVAVGGGPAPYVLAGMDECPRGRIARSADGGRSWQVSSALGFPRRVHALAVAPSDPSRAFAAHTDSVSRSLDGGKTWTNVPFDDSFGGVAVTHLAVSPADADLVLAASGSRGLARSTDGGETWQTRIYIGDPDQRHRPGQIAFDPRDGRLVFAVLQGVGVARSLDAGTTWELTGGISTETEVVALAFDPVGQGTAVAATRWPERLLYRTTDGGATWEAFGERLPTDLDEIVFDPRGGGIAFALSSGSRLYHSTDHGASWALHPRAPEPAEERLQGLAVGPDGTVFVGSFSRGVFRIPAEPEACSPGPRTACLLGGRFRAEGRMWNTANPPRSFPLVVMSFGGGRATSDRSAFFESFAEGSFEIGVKMVDACGLPADHPLHSYWLFLGGLTNAEAVVEIKDTVTEQTYLWRNEPSTLPRTLGDTGAFACAGGPPAAPCEPGPERACLLGGRFSVTGTMTDFSTPPRQVTAEVMTFPGDRAESEQSAFFTSFSEESFETAVKMVDACGLPAEHPL